MIYEEYDYYEISDYINNNVDLLVTGYEGQEERSSFLSHQQEWGSKKIIKLKRHGRDMVDLRFYENGEEKSCSRINMLNGVPNFFSSLRIKELSVLVDLSSLDHILIMVLTKQFLTTVPPKSLFACYICPCSYTSESGTIGYDLSDQISAVSSVPGFVKRETEHEILCAFLGFEGTRLKGVIETVHDFDQIIPIVAFPSEQSQRFNVSIWNCMEVLQSEAANLTIQRCLSDSIFEAVEMLEKTIPQESRVVLAPLGTRPHSMACAIFACRHSHTRIIYDYVTENENRAIGISKIIVYHLSSFIPV